jgi:hypothetical protein
MSNEWDDDNNGPEAAIGNIPGSSFTWDANFYMDTPSNFNVSAEQVILQTAQVVLSPVEHSSNNRSCDYHMPIEYNFAYVSWKYIFAYVGSIMFAPLFVIVSKLLGRSSGFRIKNPNYSTAPNIYSGVAHGNLATISTSSVQYVNH